ncbi:nucleotide-diphospho-sugar transferase, partial [Chytridium lagenaria]
MWLGKNSNRHISNSINLTTYVASPCSSSNNDYNDWKNYTSWEDNDIKQHREDWQRWIENEFHQHYSFETANNTLIARGSPGFSGRGIVINMAGESLMHYFRLALHILRENGCFLPIEVWAFDGELSESAIQNLTAMSLGSQSITVRLADDPKNFMSSLANSRFEEVLMLDVDVVPLRNPEFLFEIPEYQIGGDLFWPDYWKTSGIPCVDEWEQESGMMVVNKRRAWKAIMLNWYLNRNTEIRTWHEFLFGDKDLFRFIWKATNTPAYFIQHWLVP